MTDRPRRVLLVILNYNGNAVLRPCLESLQEWQGAADVRIVVSDNGSTDGSAEMVRDEFPWVGLHENEKNLGFSRGNNIILTTHEADDYVLLNNDVETHPGWLEAMTAAARHQDVGVVGAKLLFPDGRIQHAGGLVDAYGPRHHGYLAPADSHNEARDVDYVTFAAVLIKRETIERIGYLDEGYHPMYYEDADYCLRARAAGLRIRYAPESVLLHKENATSRATPPPERLLMQERNRLRLKFIHFPASWWWRSAIYETKKVLGNLRDGTISILLQAWRDNLRAPSELRERRRHRSAFVASEFSPSARHAPTVKWTQESPR